MRVPFSPPDINQADVALVTEALTSGWITTGPKTKDFEQRISAYCHTDKTVCLNSATAAMELTLRVLGIGPGDEVITTAYTYTASASVIAHVGATPVLVDVDEDSFFISAKQVAAAITPRTKAIIPVDFAGVPYDCTELYNIIEQSRNIYHGNNDVQNQLGRIVIMADGAHSFGASRGGIHTGGLADFTCFSFHAVKNLTTAEGGAVTWKTIGGIDDMWLYKQYMLYSLHGQNKDALAKTQKGKWRYDILIPGYKCNMTDIAAALGISQLSRYEAILARRRELLKRYESAFANVPQINMLPHYTDEYISSGHLCIIRLMGMGEEQRDRVIEEMAERDVATNVHYVPLPMMTAYKNMGNDIKEYPNAFKMYENEITLPVYSTMTNEVQDYVIRSFIEVVKKVCS